ncbi:MAG: TonB-dependent receptor [Bacteroidales bacterium]|nr:TonB-dependent receptor [Bacteroidales bacterium]
MDIKRILQVAATLLLLSKPIQGQVNVGTDAGIVGHVIDAQTGDHVPYVNVMIEGTSVGAVSDVSGHFIISNCPVGTHRLMVRGLGYKQAIVEVTTERQRVVEIDVRIEPDVVALQQVVITATQHATTRSEAVATVSVVSADQLEKASAFNLGEGLTMQTGVGIDNTCQNCGAYNVRLNGLGGEYSQVLINSRPVNGALSNVYLLEQLPSSMIDRIEVMRGGGSALYGSNAIAGVINVITKDPLTNAASVANTTRLIGGKALDLNNAFNASAVTDNLSAGLFIYGHNRHRDPYDRNNDGYSEVGLLKAHMLGMSGFVRTSNYSKLNIEYHNIKDYRRGGDLFNLPPNQAHVSEGGEHDIHSGDLRWDWFAVDGKSHLTLFTAFQNANRESYYGERDDSEPYGNSYGYTKEITTNEGVLFCHSFFDQKPFGSEFTVGLEHSYTHLQDYTLSMPDTVTQMVNTASLYAQDEWHNDRWTLLAGVRADIHSMLNKPIVSPRLNVRYAPTNHIVFRVGYATGFRAPQVYDEDLHVGAVNGELYRITNATNLRHEKSHSFTAASDICFHIANVEGNIAAEAFYTQINDAFVNELLFGDTTTGIRHYERRNEDGAVVKGINVEVRINPINRMQLVAGATWQSSRYTGNGQEWDEGKYEQRMERVPNCYGYFTADYRPIRQLSISVTGTFTGSMLLYHTTIDEYSSDEIIKQVKTPAFFDAGIKASYTIPLGAKSEIEISCGVKNILDSFQDDFDSGWQRDASYIYGPLLPRTYYAGAQLKL